MVGPQTPRQGKRECQTDCACTGIHNTFGYYLFLPCTSSLSAADHGNPLANFCRHARNLCHVFIEQTLIVGKFDLP